MKYRISKKPSFSTKLANISTIYDQDIIELEPVEGIRKRLMVHIDDVLKVFDEKRNFLLLNNIHGCENCRLDELRKGIEQMKGSER